MNRTRVLAVIRVAGVSLTIVLATLLAVRLQARARAQDLEQSFREKLGPLEVSAYSSPQVPDAENAAIWLRAAARSLHLEDADKELVGDLGRVAADDWSTEQQAALAGLLTRQAPALDLAGRVGPSMRSGYGLTGTEGGDLGPKLPSIDLIWLARLLDVDGRRALAAGDEERFVAAAGQIFAIAASLERESPLIAGLVGVATERLAFHSLAAAASTPELSREAIERVGRLGTGVDLVAAWRHTLASEGAGAYTDAGKGLGPGGKAVFPEPKVRDERLSVTLALADRAGQPLGLDHEAVARLEQSKPAGSERSFADHLAAAFGARYQSALSLRRLSRLAFALRFAGLAAGSYPDTLAAWPEALLPDPFTGGALLYERHRDGSATIGVPGAEELYNRVNEIRNFCPFVWKLPAPR